MHAGQLEVLAAAARRDVDDPRAFVDRDLVPRDHPVLDARTGGQRVERALVPETDECRARHGLVERLFRIARGHHPLAVLAAAVEGLGMDGGGDVCGERPRRRRPDHEGLAGAVEEREADGERRVGPVLVDARLRQLVLREGRAAAGAPLGRPVTHVDAAPLVHEPQEPPDVLDVRVAEGEVVGAPVHPLAKPDRALGQLPGRPDDLRAAPARELGKAELLDLALRVEPELPLDADLDPEPLAVEAVLVALVMSAERLVALEDVLERPPPGRVHRQGLVRRDRAVDEAEARAVGVQLPQPAEGLLALPQVEDPALQGVVVRLVRQACEHGAILGKAFSPSFVRRSTCDCTIRTRKDPWHST